MTSQAFIPQHIQARKNQNLLEFASFALGTLLLILLAQVKIPLAWTPVPLTGQTFGVLFMALLWGWKRAGAIISTYLCLGFFGLPVFASLSAGVLWGPTLGYLIGMGFAALLVGFLSDRGYAKNFWSAFAATWLGTAVIFLFGVLGLSFFIPSETLFVSGVAPFLPGALIKNTAAALLVSRCFKPVK